MLERFGLTKRDLYDVAKVAAAETAGGLTAGAVYADQLLKAAKELPYSVFEFVEVINQYSGIHPSIILGTMAVLAANAYFELDRLVSHEPVTERPAVLDEW
jgi:hypothetical protein